MLFFQRLRLFYALVITIFLCIILIRFTPCFISGFSIFKSPTCRLPIELHHIPSSHASNNCPLLSISHLQTGSSHTGLASALSPAELFCRTPEPLSRGIPKLFHQSWKSKELPAKFKKWSDTCRRQHPDWEWVLWTDEDNLQLVKLYFPWLEDTFLNLPGNIYRADLARNLYMYTFGGIYADLDTECLRPTLDTLESQNISLLDKPDKGSSGEAFITRVALFGRMGSDLTFDHNIPNAWMAATARHPFFLFPMSFAQAEMQKSRRILHRWWYDYPSAEQLTGPIALRKNIQQFESCGDAANKIILLPDTMIYPFNWNAGEEVRSLCSAEKDTFDENQCKDMLNVELQGSVSITYWTHTHRGKGPDIENIERISQDK